MSSLLDDVNQLLNQNKGDAGRLNHIKETLEKNKILYVSDRQYLTDLSKKYLENKIKKTSQIKTNLNYSEKSDDMLYSENENIVGNDESKIYIQKESESKIFCTSCGNQMLGSAQFCTNCGKSPNATIQSNASKYQQYSQPAPSVSGIWYLLPILFGLLGGIIAWIGIRKRDSSKARNCLILGVIVTIIVIIPGLTSFGGTSEVDDALSEFPEQIQNIKRAQMSNCENNMGYLQSFELGEMIKDRCIKSILGK